MGAQGTDSLPRRIRVLPEAVVQKIAAGEVIERPASIVKELVENSLDAGATRIEIRVSDGGKKSISVTDDGSGIPADQVSLALTPHATSKIESDTDLTNVASLGFRGEALASIAAVSQLDLLTRTQASPSGVRLRAEGGVFGPSEPFGMPAGTTVSVNNLFFNTPARRKFLRSRATELGHVETMIRRMALCKLDAEFLLESDGEILLHLPPADSARQRVEQLYGRETTENLMEIRGEYGPHRATGFVSNHKITFSRPQELWLFVNRRAVRDRMLQSAVLEGFRSALMERRYPMAIVWVEMPPALVDVNVHPTKAEVRFSDSQPVFRVVSEAVKSALAPRTAEGPGLAELPPIAPSGGPSPLGFDFLAPASAHTAPTPYPAPEPGGVFSSLHLLDVLDQTYLLLKGEKALFVVDQHAAHERVKFEDLKRAFESNLPKVQQLLIPLTLEVTASQEAVLAELEPFLRKIGFETEPFGLRTLVIKTVPHTLGTHDPRPILAELANSYSAEEAHEALKDHRDDLLSRIACHSAVRAHDRLSPQEVANLLSQMDRVDLASHCPHGRPTYLRFTLGDFERLFHRK